MDERKLDKILEVIRAEPPPAVPAGFERRVLLQVGREPTPQEFTLLDQLNQLFPQLACAAVVAIVLCIAGDYLLGAMSLPGLSEGLTRISDQWLLPSNGI